MTKKIIVSVIAVVLVAAVIGTCFALYKLPASDVTVTIDATADVCNLTIGTSASLDFASISPENDTKTVNITLSTSNNALADGVNGNFKVAITGELADAFDATVVACTDDTFAVEGDPLAAALTNAGANLALSTMPKYYKLTLTLKDAYDATGFAAIAEKTGTITVSWTVVEGSVFVYDNDAYYAIGKINGVNSWDPTVARYLLTADDKIDANNIAEAHNVYFAAGDEIKVVWNFYGEGGQAAQWYGNNEGGNLVIGTAGHYNVFLYNNNGYHISATRIGD